MREADILARIERGEVEIPPLTFRLVRTSLNSEVDAILEARWRGQRYRFAAEVKSRSAPKFVQAAMESACKAASPPKTFPMVIVPYLNEKQLQNLEDKQVSGIDLNGNGVIVVPGRLLVIRTGKPNGFREKLPIKNVYRGKVSMAARVFLLRPRFSAVSEIHEEVRQRGGMLAISTISKVLRRLEDDLVVGRESGEIRLLQPDKLLDQLATEYRPPDLRRMFVGRTDVPTEQLVKEVSAAAARTDLRVALTGSSSVSRYAVMAREEAVSLYCSDIGELTKSFAGKGTLEETERFANVRLLETTADLVYFDLRREDDVPWASPIQSYVELMAGDKRDRESASQVAEEILQRERSKDA